MAIEVITQNRYLQGTVAFSMLGQPSFCLTMPLQQLTLALQRVNNLRHPLPKGRDAPATTSPLAAVIAAIESQPQWHWLRRSLWQEP